MVNGERDAMMKRDTEGNAELQISAFGSSMRPELNRIENLPSSVSFKCNLFLPVSQASKTIKRTKDNASHFYYKACIEMADA